jgi:integrase
MQVDNLTDSVIAKAKPDPKGPYQISQKKSNDRLAVLVSVAGSKTWRWSYRFNDKDRAYIIGKYPAVKVIDARKKLLELEAILASGHDPKVEEQQAAAKLAAENASKLQAKSTLWNLSYDWLRANRYPKKWGKSYTRQAISYMRKYVRNSDAKYGDRPIKSISTADVFALVNSIADRKGGADKKGKNEVKAAAPTVAMLVKQWLDQVFQRAIAMGYCENNPVAGLKTSIAVPNKKDTKHNKDLSPSELGALLGSLSEYKGAMYGGSYYRGRTTIALELLVLTFVRTGELRQAQWPEFDLVNRMWTVPASRMKIKTAGNHKVPLSTQAVALLLQLREMGVPKEGTPWLFPNTRDPRKCMHSRTINALLDRYGFNGKGTIGFAAHGTRGTASTLLHDVLKYPTNVIEVQLAHAIPGIAGVYNSATYLDQRIPMMQAWADYVDTLRPVEVTSQDVAA